MNLLPVIAIGGTLFLLSQSKKKKKAEEKEKSKFKELPPAKTLGTIFGEDGELPDVIDAKSGERFTIAVEESAGTPYSWKLAATPVDEILSSVDPKTVPGCSPVDGAKYCYIEAVESMPGAPVQKLFIFEAKEPGEGAIVLHYAQAFGDQPPEEVIDIKVKVTGA